MRTFKLLGKIIASLLHVRYELDIWLKADLKEIFEFCTNNFFFSRYVNFFSSYVYINNILKTDLWFFFNLSKRIFRFSLRKLIKLPSPITNHHLLSKGFDCHQRKTGNELLLLHLPLLLHVIRSVLQASIELSSLLCPDLFFSFWNN